MFRRKKLGSKPYLLSNEPFFVFPEHCAFCLSEVLTRCHRNEIRIAPLNYSKPLCYRHGFHIIMVIAKFLFIL